MHLGNMHHDLYHIGRTERALTPYGKTLVPNTLAPRLLNISSALPRGGRCFRMAPIKVTFKTVQGNKFELDLDSADKVCNAV